MNPPHHEEDYEADTRAWEFDEETIDVTVASHQTEHGGQLSRPDRNGNAVRTNTFGSGSSMGNRSRVERASAVHPSNMDSNLKDKNFGTKKGFLAKNGKFRLANSAKDGSAQAGHQVHQGPIRQRNAQAAPSALAYGGMGWSTDSRSRAPHVFDSSNYGYSKAFALDSSKNGQFSSRHSTRGRMHPSRTSTRGRMYPSSASLDGQFSGRHSTGGRMHSSSASRVPTNAGRIRQPGASRLPVDVGRTQQPRADIKASHADLRKGLERGTHHIQRLSTYGLTNRREWDSATKRNFARSTGPINARITKTKEETKKQSADRDRYLTQPEAGEKFEIELYFQVDDMSIELLTEDDQALNEIRIGFGVFITYDLALECLRIQANQQRDPDHVIAAIRNTLKRLGTNTSGSASKFLIYPPSPEDYRPDVIAVSLQPFRVAMRGQAITQPELGSYAEWGQKQVIRHDDQLLEKLREKMEDLRFHKEQWIKMCVKYGTLELTNYHARLNAEGMPFKEFFSMLESNRCRGILKEW